MSDVTVAQAQYAPSPMPEFAGNPYIEALPAILDEMSFYKGVRNLPEFAREERDLAAELRQMAVHRLRRCVVPTQDFWQVYQRVSRLLRLGYVNRNPLDVRTKQWHYAIAQNKHTAQQTTVDTVLMIGPSGSGKSTLIRSVLGRFPQVIRHDEYDATAFRQDQLVYVMADIPHDASRRELCLSILDGIDRALGTDHGKEWREKRQARIDDIQHAIKTLFVTYGVGILIIDEMQHLNLLRRSGGRDQTLQLFDSFVNEVAVPVLQIGTPATERVFQGVFRSSRRAGTGGHIRIKLADKGSEAWTVLLRAAWKRQWVQKPAKLTAELDDLLYDLSQGLPACLFRLLALTQEAAIEDGSERITASGLKRAYKEHFGLMRHALSELRVGRRSTYEDLMEANEWFSSGGVRGSIAQLKKRVRDGQVSEPIRRELLAQIRDIRCECELTPGQEKILDELERLLGGDKG